MSELKSVTYRLIGGGCSGDYVTCPAVSDFVTAVSASGVECEYVKVNFMIAGDIFSFMISRGDGISIMHGIITNLFSGIRGGFNSCMVREIVGKIGGVEL